MKILSIETSLSQGFFAVFDEKGIVFHKILDQRERHSHLLMKHIQQELMQQGYALSDISVFAAGLGPGSFLGTRIGVILAKTLAYGLNAKVMGFCSLSLYSPNKEGPFYVLSDAKSKGVYALRGEKTTSQTMFEQDPNLYSFEELEKLYLGETLITAQPELLTKNRFLSENGALAKLDFELHHREILAHLDKKNNGSDPLKKLDIHYLRLC